VKSVQPFERSLLAAACVVAVFVASAQAFHFAGLAEWEGNDDAYISFRYAQNFEQGHGLVFNAGEERVEGYSNFLYTLMIAAGMKAGGVDLAYYYALAINIAAVFLLCILIAGAAHLRLTVKLGAIVLTSLTPAIAFWTTSGLEAVPVAAVQLGIVLSVEQVCRFGPRRRRVAALAALCVLSSLLRADGFLVPALALVYLALHHRITAIQIGAATAACNIGYFAWRYGYYGGLLPMTYHAKVSGMISERLESAHGVMQTIFWQTGIYLALAILFAGAAACLWQQSGQFWRIPFRYWLIGAWLSYWYYIGGDIYYDRFLIVFFPLAWITLSEAIHWSLSEEFAPKQWMLASLATALLVVVVLTPRWMTYEAQSIFHNRGGSFPGEYLRRAQFEGKTLAIDAAGKIPFVSGLRTIDMFGLNDPHIGRSPASEGAYVLGHTKTDMEYVLDREPELIAAWGEGFDVVAQTNDSNQLLVMQLPMVTYRKRGYEISRIFHPIEKSFSVYEGESTDWERIMMRGHTYVLLQRQ